MSVHLLHLWWRSSALTVKPHCSVSPSCPLTFPSHLPSSLALCVLLLPSLLLGCHVRVSGWHWEDCCICISLLTTAGGEFTNTVTRWLGIKQLLRWNGCALLRVLPCNRDPSKWRTLSWKHHNYSCCQSKSTPKSEISAGAAKAVVPNLFWACDAWFIITNVWQPLRHQSRCRYFYMLIYIHLYESEGKQLSKIVCVIVVWWFSFNC